MNSIINYKSKIASRYIPVDPEQIGLKIAESDYYMASIKHDGHLAFLAVKKGNAQLFDRNGDEIKIPQIIKAAASIKEDVILAGELCCFEGEKTTSNREVSAAIAKPDSADLRFGAFDLIEVKGATANAGPKEKAEQLKKLLEKGKEIFAIEQHIYESRKDLSDFYKSATDQDAEGVVIKVPTGVVYKVKQVYHLDLVVLGYAESTAEKEGLLRELLLGFAIGKNNYHIVTKCGGGFTDKDRVELPKQLQNLTIDSEYTEVSGAKTAFIFVKPEMVVEISCLDLINENSQGAIRKGLLEFDPKKGYSYAGNVNTLSIVSPNFVRIRTDKKPDEQDAGTAQAYELLRPIENVVATETEKDSEIIIREIFTKAAKGGTGIRKFIGLKTNKEQSGMYPPFVVIYSDYSAGRQTPLEQELYLCSSAKEAQLKVEELKEENIKKGWEAYK